MADNNRMVFRRASDKKWTDKIRSKDTIGRPDPLPPRDKEH